MAHWHCSTGGGLPLGIAPSQLYEEAMHQLVPGDQLVLYTDGITEALNNQGEQFGMFTAGQGSGELFNRRIGHPALRSGVDRFIYPGQAGAR